MGGCLVHVPTRVSRALMAAGRACASAVSLQCGALPRNPAQGWESLGREGVNCGDPILPAPLTPTRPSARGPDPQHVAGRIASPSRNRLCSPARCVHSAPGGRGCPTPPSAPAATRRSRLPPPPPLGRDWVTLSPQRPITRAVAGASSQTPLMVALCSVFSERTNEGN